MKILVQSLNGGPAAVKYLASFYNDALLVLKVYVIKIAVRGVSPMVWCRLRIAADTSPAELHFIIQLIQGWGDDHLYHFHIYGKDYGITYEGGIGFPDNPSSS